MRISSVLIATLVTFGSSMLIAQNRSSTMRQTKQNSLATPGSVRLITLAPGHFHASLVQKVMYPQVAPTVWVYAPPGPDLDEHSKRVEAYNTRTNDPTRWEQQLYSGPDFFQKMLADKPGNVVVIAGNNREKIAYLAGSLQAGLNVLADKPMCIDAAGFEKLKASLADKRGRCKQPGCPCVAYKPQG